MNDVKRGISYASVAALGVVIGALLGLRIYAGLPERHAELSVRHEKLEERVTQVERQTVQKLNSIDVRLAEIGLELRQFTKWQP